MFNYALKNSSAILVKWRRDSSFQLHSDKGGLSSLLSGTPFLPIHVADGQRVYCTKDWKPPKGQLVKFERQAKHKDNPAAASGILASVLL